MKYRYILILWLCNISAVFSQDTLGVIDGALLEELLTQDDEQTYDFLSLYEELQTYLKHPLNINKADDTDFRALGMLTDQQIYNILDHRDQNGDFISIYELQSVAGLDVATLKAFIPLVTTGSDASVRNLRQSLSQAQQNVFIKYKSVLQDRKGYTRGYDDGGYEGNPATYYLRYHLFSGQFLRIGMTMEKDPGEAFFTGSNKSGFDYYSGFIYARDVHPIIKDINIGDYAASMGQGLIMHNSFGGGKSSFVMNVKKDGRPIRPYSSVNEANFFRGLGTNLRLSKNLTATLLLSSKKIDGSGLLSQDTITNEFDRFNTINVSGYHRTRTEIDRERNVSQSNIGSILTYKGKGFKVGLNTLYTRFDKSINPSKSLYKKYYFNGDKLINSSLDYSFRYKNFSFFGEVAGSDNLAIANLHGVMMSVGRDVDASIVYRNYPRDYQVLSGNAFGESTLPINEEGIYVGLRFKPLSSITVSTYFDQWRHPWLRFRKGAPSQGKEFLVKVDYYKKRKFNAYLQYRYEAKQEDDSNTEAIINPLVDLWQHRLRLHFSYKISKSLEFRNRAEFSSYGKSDLRSEGYLLYHDVIYKPIASPISFTARYAIFDTEYNSRIYAYENDILYEFSIPFYSGKGNRFYINTRYRLNRMITAEMHYGYTIYPEGPKDPAFTGISSGNEYIDGNVLSELKFQVKLRF